MVLELLLTARSAPYRSRIATAQMRRATRPSTVYSGSMPLEKKNDRLGAKSSIVHAAGEVGLDVGEPVGEGERELADGVRPGLGDVVAGDRHRVEVADLVVDEPLLDVGHHPQRELGGEDAGVLPLVLLEDVGLHRAADVRSTHARISLALLRRRARGRAPRAKTSTCWSIAVLRKNARMVGAGPLMVIDTEVVGPQRSKPS